jgi:hypothetical protein
MLQDVRGFLRPIAREVLPVEMKIVLIYPWYKTRMARECPGIACKVNGTVKIHTRCDFIGKDSGKRTDSREHFLSRTSNDPNLRDRSKDYAIFLQKSLLMLF